MTSIVQRGPVDLERRLSPDTATFYPPVDRPFEDYAQGYVDYPALAFDASLSTMNPGPVATAGRG